MFLHTLESGYDVRVSHLQDIQSFLVRQVLTVMVKNIEFDEDWEQSDKY